MAANPKYMRKLLALIAVLIVAFLAWRFFFAGPKVTNFEECETAGGVIMESFPRRCVWEGENYTEEIENQDHAMINVTFPDTGSLVTSPIEVTGFAKGGWYFEGTFPLKVTDLEGNVLGSGSAKSQGDWMTENFVPFKGQISYERGTADKGYLVLEKDNPSGLPENADSLVIPIVFVY